MQSDTPDRAKIPDAFSWIGIAWARIPASSKLVFYIAVVANLASYGFIFSNLTLNHDAFGAITVSGSVHRNTGRWFADVIYGQVFGTYAVVWLYCLIGVVLFIFTAFSICRVLRITELSSRLTAVLLFTLFPYVCGYYAYAYYVPVWGVAILLAIGAVECGLSPVWCVRILGSFCIVLSLSSYQAFISSILTLICVFMV